MREQKCTACQTINELEFTLRSGNTETITIRCKTCKKLLRVDPEKSPKATATKS